MIKEHYARAGVPMLPVKRGDQETARQIVRYTVLLVVVTLVPVGARRLRARLRRRGRRAGRVFAWYALELRRTLERVAAVRLFHYSLLYLALLFVAMAADPIL